MSMKEIEKGSPRFTKGEVGTELGFARGEVGTGLVWSRVPLKVKDHAIVDSDVLEGYNKRAETDLSPLKWSGII